MWAPNRLVTRINWEDAKGGPSKGLGIAFTVSSVSLDSVVPPSAWDAIVKSVRKKWPRARAVSIELFCTISEASPVKKNCQECYKEFLTWDPGVWLCAKCRKRGAST